MRPTSKIGFIAILILIFLGISLILSPSILEASNGTDQLMEETVNPQTGARSIWNKLRGAAGRNLPGVEEIFPTESVVSYAGRLVRAALALVGLIFFTLMIYGGSLYLTAGGNEEQVKKARHVLARAAIGGLIVIFAGAITQFLTGQLGRRVAPATTETGPCPRGQYYDTSIFGGCDSGYTWQIDAPDEAEDQGGLDGAVCRCSGG